MLLECEGCLDNASYGASYASPCSYCVDVEAPILVLLALSGRRGTLIVFLPREYQWVPWQ